MCIKILHKLFLCYVYTNFYMNFFPFQILNCFRPFVKREDQDLPVLNSQLWLDLCPSKFPKFLEIPKACSEKNLYLFRAFTLSYFE